jgi:hypothetical protein
MAAVQPRRTVTEELEERGEIERMREDDDGGSKWIRVASNRPRPVVMGSLARWTKATGDDEQGRMDDEGSNAEEGKLTMMLAATGLEAKPKGEQTGVVIVSKSPCLTEA